MVKKELLSNRRCVLHRWKVLAGETVVPGTVLFVYKDPDTDKLAKFKCKTVGTVISLTRKPGDLIHPEDPLLEIDEICPHDTVVNDLCAICGVDLLNNEPSTQPIPPQNRGLNQDEEIVGSGDNERLVGGKEKLGGKEGLVEGKERLASDEKEKLAGNMEGLVGDKERLIGDKERLVGDKERLLRERRLVLLVDLDQTLVHSTHYNIPSNIKDVYDLKIDESCWYHMRLRPHTRHFLAEMNQYFELHICTFGVRQYADSIAAILDCDKTLFSDRILSREECLDPNSKHANLKALFPSGDELVCIIDDRKDVWNNSPNLISVKPYVFFTDTPDVNSSDPPHQLFAKGVTMVNKEASQGAETMQVDEAGTCQDLLLQDEDDYLLYLETILKKVHQRFYQLYDERGECSVKLVLEELRGRVLDKCEIVLSGLVPLHAGIETSQPYHIVNDLGGKISKSVSESTTHVVGARDGTVKIREGRKYPHIRLVNPDWLIECLYRWEMVDERLFPVKKVREKDKTCESSSAAASLALSSTGGGTEALSRNDPCSSELDSTGAVSLEVNSNGGGSSASFSSTKNGDALPDTRPECNSVKDRFQHTDSKDNRNAVIDKQACATQHGPTSCSQSVQQIKNQTPSEEKLSKPTYEKPTTSLKTIDSLISSFKKDRPTVPPPVLDFLKHKNGNSDNMKKFQIPKRVRIEETPQIRLIESNDHTLDQSPPKKRKKKTSPKKKTDLTPSSSLSNGDCDFENVDYMRRNKQMMLMKLKQLETSQRILEDEHSIRRRQSQDEFMLRMDQVRENHSAHITQQNEKHNLTMQNLYSEHEERIRALQSEHLLRMKQMNQEHEVRLKHLHQEHLIRVQCIATNNHQSLTSDGDSDD